MCRWMSISHCVSPSNAVGATEVVGRSLHNSLERSQCLAAFDGWPLVLNGIKGEHLEQEK